MNAEQIREIVQETIRQELAAFFAVQSDASSWKQDQAFVSPAEELRIRAMARENMRIKAQQRASKGVGNAK